MGDGDVDMVDHVPEVETRDVVKSEIKVEEEDDDLVMVERNDVDDDEKKRDEVPATDEPGLEKRSPPRQHRRGVSLEAAPPVVERKIGLRKYTVSLYPPLLRSFELRAGVPTSAKKMVSNMCVRAPVCVCLCVVQVVIVDSNLFC